MPSATARQAGKFASTSPATAKKCGSTSRTAAQVSRPSFAARRYGALAASTPAGRKKAPALGWPSLRPSPTCTRDIWSSKTTGPGFELPLSFRCGRAARIEPAPPEAAAESSARATTSASQPTTVRFHRVASRAFRISSRERSVSMAQHGYLREYDEDFGDDRDRGDWRDRDDRDWRSREHGRGFMFGREDRDQRAWENNRDWPQRERSFRSSTDDHYRSWRDRQMQALDRDYADYCREREQAFHRDFDAWRDRRHGTPQPL